MRERLKTFYLTFLKLILIKLCKSIKFLILLLFYQAFQQIQTES